MMTPDSPPTANGSPPPPILSDLTKGSAEHDLWAFDEVEETPVESPPVRLQPPGSLQPVPRDVEKMRARQLLDAPSPKSGNLESLPRIGTVKPQPKASLSGQGALKKPGQDFDDLDSWEEASPPPQPPPPLVIRASQELQFPPEITATTAVTAPITKALADRAEIPPEVRPTGSTLWQLLSQVKLSFVEWCGLLLLLGLLGAGAVAVYVFTIRRLPSESELAKTREFPIQGEHFSILAAASHWRTPNPSDKARLGSQLIPVLTLKCGGGPATLRIFFRNSEGEMVGDAVTRPTKDDGELEIPASAGFDDVGMHAAYRTGQGPRWTIEIWEAPVGKSTGADFKKLFSLPVSTVCR